jgi:hypothetical protein
MLMFGSWVGIPMGVVIGFYVGTDHRSWPWFWWTLVGTWVAVTLLFSLYMAATTRGSGPLGSPDNPHEFGSTAWYRHENERKKYYGG